MLGRDDDADPVHDTSHRGDEGEHGGDPFYEDIVGAAGHSAGPPPVPRGVPQPSQAFMNEHRAELEAEDPDETLAERGRLVWQWYKVFAACMAVMCLFTLLTGIVTVTDPNAFPQVVQFQNFISGWSMVLLSLVGIVAYAAAPIVLPETQWAWAVHLVLISVATVTCCCAPISIPLVIMWCSPAVRMLFVD